MEINKNKKKIVEKINPKTDYLERPLKYIIFSWAKSGRKIQTQRDCKNTKYTVY